VGPDERDRILLGGRKGKDLLSRLRKRKKGTGKKEQEEREGRTHTFHKGIPPRVWLV
jgi:hypothetical protein